MGGHQVPLGAQIGDTMGLHRVTPEQLPRNHSASRIHFMHMFEFFYTTYNILSLLTTRTDCAPRVTPEQLLGNHEFWYST